MKLRLLLLFAVSALVVLSSCKDDKDDPTPEEMIVGSWNLIKEVYTEDGVTETYEGEGLGDACDRDDLWVFAENNTLTLDEGPTKCDPNAPQVYGSGQWTLLNNGSQLQITDSGEVELLNITTLTNSKLVISYSETYEDGGENFTYTEEYTFTKK